MLRCLIISFAGIAGWIALSSGAFKQIKTFTITGYAQGTSYHITYYAENEIIPKKSIDSIFHVLDSSLSIYKPYSLISRFNNHARGIIADAHLSAVVQRSLRVSKISNGRFDITVLPLVNAWGFGTGGKIKRQPSHTEIRQILNYVGYHKLYFKKDSLIKKNPKVQIDVDGIAQGYSVDVIAMFMEKNYIYDYLVEVGGEIRVAGRKQPGNTVMKIGIESPATMGADSEVLIRKLALEQGAVTTSGKYRRYVAYGNKKYSHLIDPRSGYPLQNNMISVTVWAKNAMLADAYDNVLMAMDLKHAFKFLKKQKDIAAYFIYEKEGGLVADTATEAFYKMFTVE